MGPFPRQILWGTMAIAGFACQATANDPIDYNRDVRPILSKNCFPCHGADPGTREANLRLDLRAEATKELESGSTAIVPGDPENSDLVFRVEADDETIIMPPKKGGTPLSKEEIATLRAWVAAGAPYASYWSFVKPEAHPLPAVKNPSWVRNGIDAWVLARLEKEGLAPSPPADPFVLLRRLSLDLRGLPPTPAEIDELEKNPTDATLEKFVDRFLDDPAYGERWARLWLDLARYADSSGYGSDPLRPNMWRYRDWVINAYNANMPYDRFTLDQLAGDLLPDPTLDQRIATAFHRNTMTNTEGGTDDEEFRVAAIKDRVDTTGQVWMGLTINCAKCHTHKYDPITIEDYYSLFAIYNQSADNDQPNEQPVLSIPTPEITAKRAEIDARIDALRETLNTKADDPAQKPIRDEIAALEKSRPEFPTIPVMVELPPANHRVTKVLNKGNFLDPGAVVEPAVLASFHPLPTSAPANRLGLAEWLIDPENPLTARVAVNRLWSQLLGAGLVRTEEDFGTQGDAPTHPELLDWLAAQYRDGGWDTKALVRLIVTSSTYRQSSRATPELLDKDPENKLLARSGRFRLPAETIRDQALALSGLLDRKIGGPSVFPVQPEGLWQAAFNGERTWTTSPGADRYRRGLYTFWRRTIPYPSMATFDAPSRELCTVKRTRSNTPLQALVTLNDPVYVEAAQALARRIVREGGETPEARIAFALRLCLARPANPEQAQRLLALYQNELEHYRAHPDAAKALATEPLGPLPEGWDAAETAAWTSVANVLLNLDGVLARG